MKDTAIATYIDNNANLITEFGWLYKSWLYSGSWRKSRIVAFYNPEINPFKLPHDSDIIYIPSMPLSELDETWKDYKFINSTYFLTTPEAKELLNYKYVLKTDNDVFLTPFFQNLRPRLATFGIGLYALEPIVAARLAQVAAKWGIKSVFNNVGSSLMAHTDRVLNYAQLHMEYCKKLRADEFPDGVGEWPNWYFGVLTMYAGNLAANAFFGTGLTMGGLDVQCMSNEIMCETDYHIHAWHTFEYFSKFHWREGKYKGYDLNSLDKNRISDYCLWIAGEKP